MHKKYLLSLTSSCKNSVEFIKQFECAESFRWHELQGSDHSVIASNYYMKKSWLLHSIS